MAKAKGEVQLQAAHSADKPPPLDEHEWGGHRHRHCSLHHHRHPFSVPPDRVLSPRADAWLLLSLTSVACAASLSVASPAAWRSTPESAALGCAGTSAALSLCVAAGFRYGPSRDGLTRPPGGGAGPLARATPELAVAVLTFALWLITSALVLRPAGQMAVARTEIWNANLYFATWASASLASFLAADLVTSHHPSGGMLPRESSLLMGNAIPRGWALLFVASASLLACSAALGSGEACAGALGEARDACRTTAVGIAFGALGMVLPAGYRAVSLLDRGGDPAEGAAGSNSKLHLASTALSVASFICYSVNAAFVTSPEPAPGKGEPCNVYFSSWACFAISLYLCVRHAEVYLVPGSTRDIATLLDQPAKGSNLGNIERVPSRNSVSTASPHTQYSDDDDDYDDVIDDPNADDALTAMVESQSEDTPMVFLPGGHDQAMDAPSGHEDDASHPSVTPYPSTGGQHHHQYRQYEEQYRVREPREPYKPRSISPEGKYRTPSMAAASAPSIAAGPRSQAEPPDSDDMRHREDPEGHNVSSDFEAEDIDTKLQAKISSSSGESNLRSSSSRSGKSRGIKSQSSKSRSSNSRSSNSRSNSSGRRRRKKEANNPEGKRVFVVESFHADHRPQPPVVAADAVANKNRNININTRGFFVETIQSESTASSDPSSLNPLDRTTHLTPHGRSFIQPQNRSDPTTDPFYRSEPVLDHTVTREQARMREEPPPPPFGSSAGTSYATRSKTSRKSKSSSRSSRAGSGSKSRSSSRRKKRRSKSREQGGKSRKSKSPSTQTGSRQLESPMTTSAPQSGTSGSSGGPPTLSNGSNSSDIWGQGPATMSASSGVNSGVSTDSGPLTDDEPLTNEEGMEEMAMGRAGSGRAEAPQPGASPGGIAYDVEGGGGTFTAPVYAIHGVSPESMSMVSEPTMEGFGPPGHEYSPGIQHSEHFLGSSEGVSDSLGYSFADLSTNNSTSETNDNNKALRQGAVDKMVMEALRQAHEARQGGGGVVLGGGRPPPPAAPSMDLHRQPTQASNPQAHTPNLAAEVDEKMSPALGGRGGRQTSMQSRTSSRRSTHSSSIERGGRKQHRSSSSGRASGSSGKIRGGKMHSFYSGSDTDTSSFQAEDAFAC